NIFVASVMEHIELAGIHSGDSACSIPPPTLPERHLKTIAEQSALIARDFNVVGILNVQFAVCEDQVWIIEANPRASRTVPIVAKVTGVPLAKVATLLMLGAKLEDCKEYLRPQPATYFGVKEAVFPFNMFPEVDPVLGPEMRATGEVMGMANTFGMAYFKSQQAAGMPLPLGGKVLVSVAKREREELLPIVTELCDLGFELVATEGTGRYLAENNIPHKVVCELNEGRPNVSDLIKNREVSLIINTPLGKLSKIDDSNIRMQAIQYKIPYMTTIAAAKATVAGIREAKSGEAELKSLQEYQAGK
ncbi:MAG: carbamoyl phosphate synthase large subunit, partial [Lentisphaeria bacterium]|nr:carbamoyl phosphate synthase large subunit [Lentisphaeria bacterium]